MKASILNKCKNKLCLLQNKEHQQLCSSSGIQQNCLTKLVILNLLKLPIIEPMKGGIWGPTGSSHYGWYWYMTLTGFTSGSSMCAVRLVNWCVNTRWFPNILYPPSNCTCIFRNFLEWFNNANKKLWFIVPYRFRAFDIIIPQELWMHISSDLLQTLKGWERLVPCQEQIV